MKYLKKFECVRQEDIDPNEIYFYKRNGKYMAIGKIKPKLSNSINYIFYDYYDNNMTNQYDTLLDEINYINYYGDNYMQINSDDFNYLNVASIEEKEKYNLAISTNKFNL